MCAAIGRDCFFGVSSNLIIYRYSTITAIDRFQIQSMVPLIVVLAMGPEELRRVAANMQNHLNEYHREANFEALLQYVQNGN